MEGSRYLDLVRYKKVDNFKNELHGLRISRMVKKNGQWTTCEDKWEGGEEKTVTSKKYGKKHPTSDAYFEPTYFSYKKFVITKKRRAQWDHWDNKWLLQPFPNSEILMGYGLIQNPGW